ncbi:MAG: protein kinase [Gemmatimonadota bacterium]|nr:protein kinase [Gemmatimonadota bacterium]
MDTRTRLHTALAGRYRIERELGAGGMATVYLAFDEKHDRKVAIKVLKPELAAVLGAERFVVEIKTTAALQHPHILPLFDSGTADGFLFYVMPFIEGETIRDKLNRERQFGVDEAVRIAREVADALDYAHRHGVIHRDIKPENILLHDGRAMVMDFGIALAVSAAAGGRMTETGLSLGTPHYMSPEQATAEKEITPRSDVYSLASVLYEMLAGEPPHTGGTAQAVIMKIITDVARPVTDLRRNVPANVAAAMGKALEKLPADRFATAREFADALATPQFTHGTMAMTSAIPGFRTPGRKTVVLAAMVALAGVSIGVWGWMRSAGTGDTPVVALTLELPNARPDVARFAVSFDGARYAFENDEGLVVRDSGQREYRTLPGTAGAESPSFSPDGQWLAFHVRGHLRKIPVAGGASIGIVPNDSLLAGRVRWGQDGSIVFESGNRIYVVSPAGAIRLLAKAERGESPRLTPDGRGVLYLDTRQGSRLMYYDLAADTAFTVLEESSEAMYVPTGHLLYTATSGGLFAVRFDLKSHATSGSPVPVVADITPDGGISPFDVTANGTLVYRAGVEAEYRIVVRDPGGRLDTIPMAPKVIAYVRASPDGRTLALTVGSARGTNRHTALYDLALGALTRFTQDGGGHSPVWSPDGTRLAFTADLPGGDAEDVFVQPVDRSTPAVRLFAEPNDQHASAWPVDTILAFSSQSAPGGRLGATSTAAGGAVATVGLANPARPGTAPRPYLAAEWGQLDAAVSPDGKWAAFTSLETGTPEVFVRPFPNPASGGLVKVSSGGGQRARWAGDGRAIYYQALDGRTIKAARVTTGATVSVGATDVIMTVPALGSAWDVDRKTGKIYATQSVGGDAVRIVVIQNWMSAFRRSGGSR